MSGDSRRDLIRRAQVWSPTDIATVDVRIGPQDGRGFQPDETVSCTYVRRPQSGNSPKFHCRLTDDSVVKVKYGEDNAEVYAEVMATRIGGANLQKWSAAAIWKDRDRCIGRLKKSNTGTLIDPHISEAGRTFLASLLVQLTDQQLRDLFDVGRVVRREPNTNIDDWIQTFKHKRDGIVKHHCPS